MKLTRDSTVLVSVLDWGLGHATRTAVVVEALLRRRCRVILAGSGQSLELLRHQFPDCKAVSLPSFSPRLSGGRFQWAEIGLQSPSFLWSILREHWHTMRIVEEERPDLIISDNRYGVWAHGCPSVIITHQLHPHIATGAPRWAERMLSAIICHMIKKFDACFVPDYKLGGLSGDMSTPVPDGMRVHCAGLLSRMAEEKAETGEDVAWLGIASGPEPQRGRFTEYLIERFKKESGRRVVVCGDGRRAKECLNNGVEVIGLAEAAELKGLMLSAKNIVCRSGYTTLMDLAAIGRLDNSVELIPDTRASGARVFGSKDERAYWEMGQTRDLQS